MNSARPSTTTLRTVAAALLAAAAVVSCGASSPARIEAGSTAPSESAVNEPAVQNAAPAPPPTTATLTAPAAPVTAAAVSEPLATVPPTTTTVSGPSATVAPTTTAVLRIELGSPGDSITPVADDTREQAPNPVAIRIPRIGVDAPTIPLGLRDDGKIEVPSEADETGWWLGGPEPGEPGPAVILGHVDSEDGPAVFFDVRYLKAGDEIHIDREDGSTLTYIVDSSERHPKDGFPTDEVYGPTEQPTLRLVTCGGEYDFDVRSYPDNVIVFATLA